MSGAPEGPRVYPSQPKMRIWRRKLPLGTELWQGVGRLGLSGLWGAHMGSPPWLFSLDAHLGQFVIKELFEKLFREFIYTTDPVFHYDSYMML